VVRPGFGSEPMFLANYRYLYDKYRDGTDHARKGELCKRYVKKMVPSTEHLRGISCDVMLLFCHCSMGSRPRQLIFHESQSVSVRGNKIGLTPATTVIWTCSSYTENKVEYKKPAYGVTLSEVVRDSKLVMLFCCGGAPIVHEYTSDPGDAKPDFVVFWMQGVSHEISYNIFLGMLMTVIEQCPEADKALTLDWAEVVRRNICRVMMWIQDCRNGDELFELLRAEKILTAGSDPENNRCFRIKGSITSYEATTDAKTNKSDEDLFFDELRTLSLMIWHDGSEDPRPRGYNRIHAGLLRPDLRALTKNQIAFHEYGHAAYASTEPSSPAYASTPPSSPAAPGAQTARVDGLLLQLQGLLRGAC
jgi:hypothetical protein